MSVLVDGELVLYGFVGDSFWGDGFTASEVIDALAELGRDADVTVRLNSGGGYTDDGIAIFNTLTAHRGKVEIVVDAMAASAASVIAMAGDTVTMDFEDGTVTLTQLDHCHWAGRGPHPKEAGVTLNYRLNRSWPKCGCD